jgi:LuxR family maltose regulon positive regulatory protein
LAEIANWNGKLVEILILQSKVFLIEEEEDQAIQSLEKALSFALPQGYIRSFVDEGVSIQYLLQKVARREYRGDYPRQLLAHFEIEQFNDEELVSLLEIEPLSSRELDVMKMLVTDLTGPEITQEMNIALSTFRFHTRNIYSKLMVNNRRSAVRRAKESHLI